MVKENDLNESRLFRGTLSQGGEELPVEVDISVDVSGEIRLNFGRVPYSALLLNAWYRTTPRPVSLCLEATADDQTRFETDALHLERCGHVEDDQLRHWLEVDATCLSGTFYRRLTTPAERPVLQMHLRGFETFGVHQTTCRLGVVSMGTYEKKGNGPDTLSGLIRIGATTPPEDLAKWRQETANLAEHIRRIMSFAAASLLRSPITEFYSGDMVEVKVWSQVAQKSGLRTIRALRQEAIFDTAVASFIDPPIRANRFFFAIEWLVMDTTYNEMRLICAMTALENLIDSNLHEAEVFIEDPKLFGKMKADLKKAIRDCLTKWFPDQVEETLAEIDGKLLELNRRSLFRKLKKLASQWQVPLGGISDNDLRKAIDARNRVVHKGQYYEDAGPDDADLWVHAALIREVVTRFLFTIIGYQGDYISYVGVARDAAFPPA